MLLKRHNLNIKLTKLMLNLYQDKQLKPKRCNLIPLVDLIASWVTKVPTLVPSMSRGKERAKAVALGVTDPLTSVNGKMASDTARVSTHSQMEPPTMANGLLTKNRDQVL